MSYRMLACDDNPFAKVWLEIALNEVGDLVSFDPETDWAKSIDATQKLIASGSFAYDLVVTDMVFEGENKRGGLQILSEVKAHYPHTEVIILTAYSAFVSIDDLFDVEGVLSFERSKWVQKGDEAEETGHRLAVAIRKAEADLERNMVLRQEYDRPYKIQLREDAREFTVWPPAGDLSALVNGFQPRHWRLVRALSEQNRAVSEEKLIDILYPPKAVRVEHVDRLMRIDLGRALGGPIDNCEKHLSRDGANCAHYDQCFPTLSATRVSSRKSPLHLHSLDPRRCPLNWQFGADVSEAKAPKRVATDIAFIRQRIASCAGPIWPPLARSGRDNDLLRKTEQGYRLAATVVRTTEKA